ncbi:MAG: response regulator [Elusimicrobiota bacterium]
MNGKKDKVLIIDDESILRRLVRRSLEHAGYEVVEACDGADAFEEVRKHRPAVVLMDIHMPRLDGIAAIEGIRGIDESIAVIVMSGDPERAQLALERGALDFIAKPFDLRRLETSVLAGVAARGA